MGSGPSDSLFKALRQRYDSTSTPRNLSIIFLASVGNSKGAGLDVLATEGLVEAVTYGWIGSCPKLGRMVLENKIRAHNLPLGVCESGLLGAHEKTRDTGVAVKWLWPHRLPHAA